MQQAPKYTFSAGATQSFELGWGTLPLHGDYAYVSSHAFFQYTPDLTNPALTPAQRAQLINDYRTANALSRLNGYGLFNGRVALKLTNPNLEIVVWGQNLGTKNISRTSSKVTPAWVSSRVTRVFHPLMALTRLSAGRGPE